MLLGCLFFLLFEFNETQNGILEWDPRYIFLITLLNTWYIYPRLIEVVIYYSKQSKRQRSTYTHKRLEKR